MPTEKSARLIIDGEQFHSTWEKGREAGAKERLALLQALYPHHGYNLKDFAVHTSSCEPKTMVVSEWQWHKEEGWSIWSREQDPE